MFMPPVFPAHWHVSQPVLIADTFSSLVWKVSLPDGTPAIVKGLKPIKDIADELRGADYLVWRNGRGAVRLLGRENNLMLLGTVAKLAMRQPFVLFKGLTFQKLCL
ncbi:aminoglycoside phosphotransferase family protein, partial [Escherichia coli]|uniref:aminoglycoside phosphotransferase family protein n=1 Tax=Escherichia coli TaxID=562 RepID=UPI0021A7C6F8